MVLGQLIFFKKKEPLLCINKNNVTVPRFEEPKQNLKGLYFLVHYDKYFIQINFVVMYLKKNLQSLTIVFKKFMPINCETNTLFFYLLLRHPVAFTAYFVAGSDQEFSVSPQTGELKAIGTNGTLITVGFRPRIYGKNYQGKLVVQVCNNSLLFKPQNLRNK